MLNLSMAMSAGILLALNAMAFADSRGPEETVAYNQSMAHERICPKAYLGNHGRTAVFNFLHTEILNSAGNPEKQQYLTDTAESFAKYGLQKQEPFIMDYAARYAVIEFLYNRALNQAIVVDSLAAKGDAQALAEARQARLSTLREIRNFEVNQLNDEHRGKKSCPTKQSEDI